MDLEKFSDKVDTEDQLRMLSMSGIGGKLFSAVNSFYVDSRTCCMRVENRVMALKLSRAQAGL